MLEFPAQAGMNRTDHNSYRDCQRVPRASGDEPAMARDAALQTPSSPRKRG